MAHPKQSAFTEFQPVSAQWECWPIITRAPIFLRGAINLDFYFKCWKLIQKVLKHHSSSTTGIFGPVLARDFKLHIFNIPQLSCKKEEAHLELEEAQGDGKVPEDAGRGILSAPLSRSEILTTERISMTETKRLIQSHLFMCQRTGPIPQLLSVRTETR